MAEILVVDDESLIRDLITLTEVHRFQEKIPTMSDIFISLVKGESHA